MNTCEATKNDTIRIVHTYKEMMEIAGYWPTVQIRNDYIKGSDRFTISYEGEKVMYQNNNLHRVASMSTNYNGLSTRELYEYGLQFKEF